MSTSDGTRLACVESGAGVPYVFVRGWITHLELFWSEPQIRAFFEPLVDRFRLVRFDARGNGLSDRSPPSLGFDDFVEDVRAVVESLGAERCILHGSGFGGPIAIAYAARWPERVSHLVIDSAYASGTDLATAEVRDSFLRMLNEMRSQPDTIFAVLAHLSGPEPELHRTTRFERARSSIDPLVAIELYRQGFDVDVAAECGQVTAETLVIHRRQHPSIPFECGRRLVSLLPKARLVALDGTSANLWDEHPEVSLGAIGEFLGVGDLHPGSAAASVESRPLAVMFTDIVESVAAASRFGDVAGQRAVRQHEVSVRAAAEKHAGSIVKGTGDGFLLTFPSVSGALRAAAEIQQGAGQASVPLRIGINAGEPLVEAGDVHGVAVSLASRVTNEAASGEILVTGVVRDLSLGKGCQFTPRGEFKPKGFDEAIAIFAFDWR
ncbi:MAG: adenylate/guanylate cyclase domain-containing protein [Acidimicrobiia bacterium]|nr:adenylate/guanylate cyclase domain-containing protein [Acidimicrobiia bacterium]